MKLSKVLSIVIIAMMLVVSVSNLAYATVIKDPSKVEINDSNGIANITTVGGKIIGIIQAVGTVVAIAILVVLGIKYMMGSAAEKAEYKKTMIPYIVGALLIFAASTVAGWVFNVVTGLGK